MERAVQDCTLVKAARSNESWRRRQTLENAGIAGQMESGLGHLVCRGYNNKSLFNVLLFKHNSVVKFTEHGVIFGLQSQFLFL